MHVKRRKPSHCEFYEVYVLGLALTVATPTLAKKKKSYVEFLWKLTSVSAYLCRRLDTIIALLLSIPLSTEGIIPRRGHMTRKSIELLIHPPTVTKIFWHS